MNHFMIYIVHSDGSETYCGYETDPDKAKTRARGRRRAYSAIRWYVRSVPQIN